jgi:hypothetical protein
VRAARDQGFKFAHLDDWPGNKSGALNYALRELTSEEAEVIGIIDSDYQVQPGWLRRCAPAFADPWIGFVQTPQDYRGWQAARYYRRLYYSYKYFFAVSQPSRNEYDGAIFVGTMGLIRRVALDELGGWDEWVITEDAELSLRLLRAGWHGLHVDEVFGLFAKKAVFLRTPKTSEQTRWWEALRANWAESTLALLGFIAIGAALTKTNQLSGPLLAGLLLFPTLGLAAAPVNSWAARRAALPAWLRERRTTEYRRDRRSFAAGVATGGAVAVLGVAIAALALLFTGQPPVQTPNLAGPARGTSAPATPSRSPSTSPSATTTPTTSPSASPTTSTPTPSSPSSSPATPSASATPTSSPTPTGTTP